MSIMVCSRREREAFSSPENKPWEKEDLIIRIKDIYIFFFSNEKPYQLKKSRKIIES